jgi:hypothetical protein
VRRLATLAAAVAAGTTVIVGMIVAGASAAGAVVSGPCRATIAGEDVASRSASDPDDAIDVSSDQDLVVSAESSGEIDAYRIEMSLAGRRWTVASGDASGNSWSKTVAVKEYARVPGLYRVHAVSEGAAACEGTVLVNVDGNPLGSIAGWAGIGLTGAGVAGALAALRRGAGAARGGAGPEFDPAAPVLDNLALVSNPREYVQLVERYLAAGPEGAARLTQELAGVEV